MVATRRPRVQETGAYSFTYRTITIVESPFAVRLRTVAGKRYKKVANATAVIWQVRGVPEKTFRWLSAPELLPAVYAGAI